MTAPLRILALSPHTDDAEFGAGASIARWVAEGAEVTIVAFSACERSIPDGYSPDALRLEFAQAAEALGVTQAECLDFDVRTMPERRQAILDEMLRLRREFEPNIVLCPSRADTHQDHATIAAEAVRAFRGVTTLGYVLPWNCPSVNVTTWRQVHAANVARKIAALKCYASQSSRPYATEDAVTAHVRLAGLQAGVRFAEPFETIRSVL